MRSVEELVNAVRDAEARRYLGEAVRAYQAGAFRGAIVTIWTTVALDLIAKLRELSTLGDGGATDFVKRLDAIIAQGNREGLANIERGLVAVARDQFEFIDARESVELERLRDDRHICAHPAFVKPDQVFEPTPELVRAHLATAVDAVLSKGPTPGKKTIQRFESEVAHRRAAGDMPAPPGRVHRLGGSDRDDVEPAVPKGKR